MPPSPNLSDIQDILGAIKRLFLSTRNGALQYLYLINVLEVLFQSSRTRICLLRLPATANYTSETLQQNLLFTTFRHQYYYQLFCDNLSARLQDQGLKWLTNNSIQLQVSEDTPSLYICLAQVYPERGHLSVDYQDNAICYQSLQKLGNLLRQEPYWLEQIFACFNAIQPSRPDVQDGPYCQSAQPTENVHIAYFYQRMLKPMYEWVDDIYHEFCQTPLIQVAHPNADDQTHSVAYSNLFFFIRLNAGLSPESNAAGTLDGFSIKLVCPESQQQALSHFYHTHRQSTCQWYQGAGECAIQGVGNCVAEPYWLTLTAKETQAQQIQKHYQGLWDTLTRVSTGEQTLAGNAFRNCSITFEQRSQHMNTANHWSMSPINAADKVFACIKHRLLPNDARAKQQHPSMMFVPLYGTQTPFMLLGTVNNAVSPQPLKQGLSDWQRSFRFAEMVNRVISSRFRERVRKAYLGLAADSVQQSYQHCKKMNAVSNQQCADCLLESANESLKVLAKIYPHSQIYLQKVKNSVINRDRLSLLEIPGCSQYTVNLEVNTFWQTCIQRNFFTVEDVCRKFHSAIARAIATEDKEQRDRWCFQLWFMQQNQGRSPPPMIGDWREMAYQLGWDGHCDDE
ncbi:MAG: hypothetical protein CR991_04790 [Proteobacteria bacterium]|nr:MAG: hypothetical protein CR991_04790 [Pseudomonadota bacterium]